jgi:hypothetical protein
MINIHALPMDLRRAAFKVGCELGYKPTIWRVDVPEEDQEAFWELVRQYKPEED